MAKPNLFEYATSELSQDAFICWLLEWANPCNKEVDNDLHGCAVNLLQSLFSKASVDFPTNINTVGVKKQVDKIDVLCQINEEYVMIIEDKTGMAAGVENWATAGG